MINAAIFLKEPLSFDVCKIYPPSVKDVLANEKYSNYVMLLTTSQEDIWDMIIEKEKKEIGSTPPTDAITPLEFLMVTAFQNPSMMELIKEAIKFFTHEEVKIIPQSKTILFVNSLKEVTEPKDLRIIDDKNYFAFQNKIREAIGENPLSSPTVETNPRIARIKAKGRLRDRIKKKKGSKDSISTLTMLAALCCRGIGLNPLNIGEIAYPAALLLFDMTQDKEKYEVDIRAATTGFGSSKIKPKYWIKNKNDNKEA